MALKKDIEKIEVEAERLRRELSDKEFEYKQGKKILKVGLCGLTYFGVRTLIG